MPYFATSIAQQNLLPKTGQTISYRTGDDGTYEAGWEGERLEIQTIQGVEVVIDHATGLMWPRDFAGAGGNYGEAICWDSVGAIEYAESLSLAGFSDWRLPNVWEMLSLIDYSHYNPALPSGLFQNATLDVYWTSTTSAGLTWMAYGVDLRNGLAAAYSKSKVESEWYILVYRPC